MFGHTLITDEQLAQHLGIEFWHVGNRQFTGGAEGTRVWVNYLWRFDIDPSFHPGWTLAGMYGKAATLGSGQLRKAVWASEAGVTVGELDDDPVAGALNEVRPVELEVPAMMTLDGINYRIAFQTCYLEGAFRFSNPALAYLIGLERAGFDLCRQLGRADRSRALAKCLVLWRSYAEERLA